MQLSRKALNARWALTGGAAIVLLVVLNLLDSVLKAKTGYDTFSLQGVGSGWGIRVIVDHWLSPPDATLAGFLIGLDFLFIPLYGAALFFGALAAIDRFAPPGGRLRRIMTLLALAPIGAAICDGLENILQFYMLTHASTDLTASLALEATAAKWLGILIGLAMTVAALVGRVIKKKA
jgi:hypothetical protein